MDIALLYGGRSGEHEISIKSCSAVARGISDRHSITLIGINRKGEWFLQSPSRLSALKESPDAELIIEEDSRMRVSVIPGGGAHGALYAGGSLIKADVVFPVLHGTYGEDGTVQGLLEMADIPYVGCGVGSSAWTMDKEITKILLKNAGLPVVPYVCVTRADVNDSARYDRLLEDAAGRMEFPLFVKPCSAGSSDGAARAENERELSFALAEAFTWDNKVLIEKAIDAREVECSVTGNTITASCDIPETLITAYGPGEIMPTHAFYDYDAKYNDPDGAKLRIPAALDEQRLEMIRGLAKKAYSAVNASGMSRVDFFIDRKTEEIYLNEINTIPGFTSISLFPKMCAGSGLDFTNLLERLFSQALARHEARRNLRTSRE
ncbi:MAG: D-alanine--D-alanine ligase [Treponema sp.]|nr:D-alanine--D-alanine ligase [Treponema sp.]